jgi:predicted dehydrogenase
MQHERAWMKVIQVGMGGMGRTWIETVRASSEVEFVGFVEVNDAIADAQAAQFGLDRAAVYPTLDAALNAVRADGVINVTPPQFHKAVSFTALDAGIPVLSEKPLAGTRADAQAIVERADATGVLHMVTQNYRYTIPAQTLKTVFDSGEMGAIGGVTIEFFKGPHFGGFREEMAYPLIIDMAIHHFDMLRFFLDSDPVSVYGQSWNPSWSWYRGDASASLSFAFGNGARVMYNGSWCATGRETTWNANWRFDCAEGVVTLIDDVVMVQKRTGVEQRPGFKHVANAPAEVVAPVERPYQTQAYLLHEFYLAVTTGIKPATTCQDNLKSLNMVFDAIESFETGNAIRMG